MTALLVKRVYDAAMAAAIRELDSMLRRDVERLAACGGIVGAAARSLLDYYAEQDEKMRLAAENQLKWREGRAS